MAAHIEDPPTRETKSKSSGITGQSYPAKFCILSLGRLSVIMKFTESIFVDCNFIETIPIILCVVILATVGAISAECSDVFARMETAQLIFIGSPDEYI